MIRTGVIVALVWGLLSSGSAGAGAVEEKLAEVAGTFGPPVMWVPKPAAAPVIDGKLDDDAWRQARPVTLRFLTGRRETPAAGTAARVLADEKCIYFGVTCAEPDPERIIAAGTGRDGGLWNGDTVEFFLDPGHKSRRSRYAHVIVNPAGLIYDSKDGRKEWNAELSVKVGRSAGGWTVELAVPMNDLAVAGAIPKVWGLNINRQRPELGVVAPVRGITSTAVTLKEPKKYREGEDTAWSPTDCYSSHITQRFGHAVLEVGSADVAAPAKLFEVIYRNDFDDGKTAGWSRVKIAEENFRGKGRCIAPATGSGAIQFTRSLSRLDDVYLVMAFKMPRSGRLYYYGRAPDNEQCEADFHMVWMTPAAATARKWPGLFDYDTHGSMMAWKSHGRRRTWPGPWDMMTGHFSEPSIGSVMQPGPTGASSGPTWARSADSAGRTSSPYPRTTRAGSPSRPADRTSSTSSSSFAAWTSSLPSGRRAWPSRSKPTSSSSHGTAQRTTPSPPTIASWPAGRSWQRRTDSARS